MWIRRAPGQSFAQVFGLAPPSIAANGNRNSKVNGKQSATSNENGNGNGQSHPKPTTSPSTYSSLPLLARFAQCAILVSSASPFGFAALRHISYPTMVLGKSCKLVPVMLMNVLLYRRKFAPYKYLVVGLVTIGISCFMGLGDASASGSKHGGGKAKGGDEAKSELWGIFLLLVNLIIDGATNSTQDEIFSTYKHINGQQMMFWLNAFSTIITTFLIAVPLPRYVFSRYFFLHVAHNVT